MNKQKGIAPILIVLLIALAVGGYFLYQKQTKPIKPQPVTQSSPILVISPAASGSAETVDTDSIGTNWKTYNNTQFGFTVKYPPNAKMTEEKSSSASYGGSVVLHESGINVASFYIDTSNCVSMSRISKNDCTRSRFINIGVTNNPQDLSVDQIVEQAFLPSNFVLTRDFSKMQVDGVSALISVNGLPAQEYAQGIFVVHKGKFYSITVSTFGVTSSQSEEAFNILQKMASTFKFTQ